jgi:hypothetical protein
LRAIRPPFETWLRHIDASISEVPPGRLSPERTQRSAAQATLLVPEALALHHMAPLARGKAAGGKTGFSPVRLSRTLSPQEATPLGVLVRCSTDSSLSQAVRAITESSYPIPEQVRRATGGIPIPCAGRSTTEGIARHAPASRMSAASKFPNRRLAGTPAATAVLIQPQCRRLPCFLAVDAEPTILSITHIGLVSEHDILAVRHRIEIPCDVRGLAQAGLCLFERPRFYPSREAIRAPLGLRKILSPLKSNGTNFFPVHSEPGFVELSPGPPRFRDRKTEDPETPVS